MAYLPAIVVYGIKLLVFLHPHRIEIARQGFSKPDHPFMICFFDGTKGDPILKVSIGTFFAAVQRSNGILFDIHNRGSLLHYTLNGFLT